MNIQDHFQLSLTMKTIINKLRPGVDNDRLYL